MPEKSSEEEIVDLKELLRISPKETRTELAIKLHKLSEKLISDYRNTIKKQGGLLTASMTYAYSRGLNDTIKFILKENNNEQK